MYLNEGIHNSFEDCKRCGDSFNSDSINILGLCEICNDDMNN